MSNNARDIQFQGFASDLWDEIIQAGIDGIYGEDPDSYCKRIIARRAYDLVSHTVRNTSSRDLEVLDYDEIPPRIPDMTELPKEQE